MRRFLLAVVTCLAMIFAGTAWGDDPAAERSAALRAQYRSLQDRLSGNQFQRPIYVNSKESYGDQKGDIHTVVDYPFATVNAALREAPNWCEILILHLIVKYCRALTSRARSALDVQIGSKSGERLDSGRRVTLAHRVVIDARDYFETLMTAATGPFGTANYTIMVEAAPLDPTHTFVHFSYSYTFGMRALLAMKAYLSTLGNGKVGFTVVDQRADGKPVYVSEMRGVLERNSMRYYLAIDAYLGALAVPPGEQLDQRLRRWFAATERYPLQLHAVEEVEYLHMKREEHQRQQLALDNDTPAR